MNRKNATFAAAATLILLTATLCAFTALKVFAAEANRPGNQTQAQPVTSIKTPTSTKWEYRVLTSQQTYTLEPSLNKLAEQGFELFEFEIMPSFVDHNGVINLPQVVMVLKREKP